MRNKNVQWIHSADHLSYMCLTRHNWLSQDALSSQLKGLQFDLNILAFQLQIIFFTHQNLKFVNLDHLMSIIFKFKQQADTNANLELVP
jgi:hypothetical protein